MKFLTQGIEPQIDYIMVGLVLAFEIEKRQTFTVVTL